MKLVALSDTHAQHREVNIPDGDVLIYAGDLMGSGYRHQEVKDFGQWFSEHPHKYKILVAGNHDRMFEDNIEYCLSKFSDVRYLQNSALDINGIKFWGSPYTPFFYNWAFNVHPQYIQEHWDKIPSDTDVLITHGPPYGILDQCRPNVEESTWGSKILIPPTEHLGCPSLAVTVPKIAPKVHIFGHIHGSYGKYGYTNEEANRLMMPKTPTRYYNVSICDEQYNPVNQPIVIEI